MREGWIDDGWRSVMREAQPRRRCHRDQVQVISLFLSNGAIWGWGRCWVRRDMLLVRSPCCFSLSLSSIFLGWKSFEGKIKPKNEFWVRQGILQSTRKMNSVWPNFLELPNTHVYGEAFPEIVWSQNKRSLKYREYACLRIHYFVKIRLKYRGRLNNFGGLWQKF